MIWNVYHWVWDTARKGHAIRVWRGEARNAPHAVICGYEANPKLKRVFLFGRADDADPYKDDPTTRADDDLRRCNRKG